MVRPLGPGVDQCVYAGICSGLPQPIRTVADELEQLMLGPELKTRRGFIEEAADVVRRALGNRSSHEHCGDERQRGRRRVNIAHT